MVSIDVVKELKEAFNLFDVNSDGFIDSSELASVVKHISGDINDFQLNQLMKRFDTDNDGRIVWGEFLGVFTTWMVDDDSHMNRKRKTPSSANERKNIHMKISRFLTQFSRNSNFDSIRSSFSDSNSFIHLDFVDTLPDNIVQQKISTSKKLYHLLPQLVAGINSNDIDEAYKCVSTLVDIISVMEVLLTPEARYNHADYILSIFRNISEASILPRVISFLTCNDIPLLQLATCKFIKHFCVGPSLANTPPDSILHPSKMLYKSMVIRAGCVGPITILLKSQFQELQHEAVLAITALASNDCEVRDMILNLGVCPVLCGLIQEGASITLIRSVTLCLSILCGHTHSRNSLPSFDTIQQILTNFATLLFRVEDDRVLLHIVLGMSFLLPGILIEEQLCRRLLQLLSFPYINLQRAVLEMFSDIFSLDTSPIQGLISFGLLDALKSLLGSSDFSLRLEAINLICILCDNGFIEKVVQADIIPCLLGLLSRDEFVRWKTVKVIKQAIILPSLLKTLLKSHDLISLIASSLIFFKGYDKIFQQVYTYYGSSFHFDFVQDIIELLLYFLNSAVSILSIEKLCTLFDLSVLEQLSNFVHVFWLDPQCKNDLIEQLTHTLILRIKEIHSSSSNIISIEIIKKVDSLIIEYQQLKKQSSAVSSFPDYSDITLKLFSQSGDNRLLSVPRSVSLQSLLTTITLSFGQPFYIQYLDKDGDKITVDSSAHLKHALSFMDKTGRYSFLLLPHSDVTPAESNKSKPLNEIMLNTRFNSKDLDMLWHQFLYHGNNGFVNKTQFTASLSKIGFRDSVQIDLLFSAFDISKDGLIDFREFVLGLSILHGGSMEERLQLAFNAYDLDGNNLIDKHELFQIITATLSAQGLPSDHDTVTLMVEKTFNMCDIDRDGVLSYSEFKQGVLHNALIVQSFWSEVI